MPEQRKHERENTTDREVTTLATLPDGTTRQGIVEDVSLGGARVRGETKGIVDGDSLELILRFLSGEQVTYQCEVVHVDRDGKHFGVRFLSQPKAVKPGHEE